MASARQQSIWPTGIHHYIERQMVPIINKFLYADTPPLDRLFPNPLSSGTLLFDFICNLSGETEFPPHPSPTTEEEMLENIEAMFELCHHLEFVEGSDVCTAEDILKGNWKKVMPFLWNLISFFTRLVKAPTPGDLSVLSSADKLRAWVQHEISHYGLPPVTNLTSCWKDGMVLCALLHSQYPDLIDYRSLSPENALMNMAGAAEACRVYLTIVAEIPVQKILEGEGQDELVAFLREFAELAINDNGAFSPSSKKYKDTREKLAGLTTSFQSFKDSVAPSGEGFKSMGSDAPVPETAKEEIVIDEEAERRYLELRQAQAEQQRVIEEEEEGLKKEITRLRSAAPVDDPDSEPETEGFSGSADRPYYTHVTVTGGASYTSALHAQGEFVDPLGREEGRPQVQWFMTSSMKSHDWQLIPGAHSVFFQMHADHLFRNLKVTLRAVAADGTEGEARSKRVPAKFTIPDPAVMKEVSANMEEKEVIYHVLQNGDPRTLVLSQEGIKLKTKWQTKLKADFSADPAILFDVVDMRRFQLAVKRTNDAIDLVTSSGVQRDAIFLTFKEFEKRSKKKHTDQAPGVYERHKEYFEMIEQRKHDNEKRAAELEALLTQKQQERGHVVKKLADMFERDSDGNIIYAQRPQPKPFLSVDGGPYHSSPISIRTNRYTAKKGANQKIEWFFSPNGNEAAMVPIPNATKASFQPTIDHIGGLLRVVLTPVTESGEREEPMSCDVPRNFLTLDPTVAQQMQDFLRVNRAMFNVLLAKKPEPHTISIEEDQIRVTKNGRNVAKGVLGPGFSVFLSHEDYRTFTLVINPKTSLDFVVSSATQRDLIVLVIRMFLKKYTPK
eukprot:TRINITY_DN5941_c0_g2_i1.p1 TRINITY_DN5941_c0_g2~~TRINITY_DN5941_c0_g2_i1.p1  ORF type:complete len:841 (+),score=221.99 TRINITY_DN5941_c0_g2_i1:2-2524(+)